jgi:hypothetical protein
MVGILQRHGRQPIRNDAVGSRRQPIPLAFSVADSPI